MLEVAKVTSTDVVYDLGCGDGRIVVGAAKERRDGDRLRHRSNARGRGARTREVHEAEVGQDDGFDEAERAALMSALDDGIAAAKAGEHVDAEELVQDLLAQT